MTIDCIECQGQGERMYQCDEMRNGDEFHGEESCDCIDCNATGKVFYKFSEFIKDVEKLINSKLPLEEEYWIGEHKIVIKKSKKDTVIQLLLNDKHLIEVTFDLRERLEALYYAVTGEEND